MDSFVNSGLRLLFCGCGRFHLWHLPSSYTNPLLCPHSQWDTVLGTNEGQREAESSPWAEPCLAGETESHTQKELTDPPSSRKEALRTCAAWTRNLAVCNLNTSPQQGPQHGFQKILNRPKSCTCKMALHTFHLQGGPDSQIDQFRGGPLRLSRLRT